MLDKLKPTVSKEGKRVGRGYGSGKGGHTTGRGTKGQKARNKVRVGFEGGQVPLYKRLPQIGGFRNPTKKGILGVSLDRLNVFKDGDKIKPENLVEAGIVKKAPAHGIKLLASGKLEKKLKLEGFLASEGAKKEIEKSGSELSQ